MSSPKNIMVVSSGFFPQISPRSFRTTELVKELARQGHKVTVLTPRQNAEHAIFEQQHRVLIKDLGKPKFTNNFLNQDKGFLSIFGRAFRRGMLQLFEYPNIELMFSVAKMLKKERGYDLLISIAVPYPIHWGVAKVLARNKKLTATWIADCGDPYMGDKTDSFRKVFYFKYLEKWFCKKADFITVPTPGSVDAYYPEFREKIRVIPQGFNFDETIITDEPINNQIPTFGYAGGFIPGIRDPKLLLEFLSNYKRPFKFIIYTTNAGMVLPYISSGDERFEIKPYIPREKLLIELSKMDFLVNINNGTTVQTPSKLIDYALTKRPVLSIESGIVDKEPVEQFLEGNYSNQLQMPNLEMYNIRNVARRFLDLSERTIDAKNRLNIVK